MLLLAAGHHALTAAAVALHPQPLGAPTPQTVPPSTSPPQPFSGDEAGMNADDAACCICLNALHRSARPNPTCAPSRAGCMRSYSRCCAPGRRACPLCRLLGGPFPPGSAPPSEEAAGDAAGSSTARHTTVSASLTAAPSPARHPSCSRQASGLKSPQGGYKRTGGVSSGHGGVSSGHGVKMLHFFDIGYTERSR